MRKHNIRLWAIIAVGILVRFAGGCLIENRHLILPAVMHSVEP